jgi:polar amino acid transport system substrate-binding protein
MKSITSAKNVLDESSLKRTLFCCLILLSLLSFYSASATELTIAAENKAPPFSNEQGEGYSFDIIDAIFENSEYQISFISLPYPRAVASAKAGLVDAAFHLTKQLDNEPGLIFGKEPLVTSSAYFYYAASSKDNYGSVKTLPSQISIGIMNGFEYGERFEEQKSRFRLVKAVDQKQLISMLVNRRVNVAIMYEDMANYTMKQLPSQQHLIRKGHLVASSEAYLALSSSTPNAKQIIEFIDTQLKSLKESGKYRSILAK